jgi:hypothetical protein
MVEAERASIRAARDALGVPDMIHLFLETKKINEMKANAFGIPRTVGRRKVGRALDASVCGSARRVPRGQVFLQRRELRVHLLFFLCWGRGRRGLA